MNMPDELCPPPDIQLSRKRRELAPDIAASFAAFSKQVFADGALPARTKQLVALAVAHVTQCPYCIRGHTRGALRAGASEAEMMEAIWVAAEMRAGGSYAHSIIALSEMDRLQGTQASLHRSQETGEYDVNRAEPLRS
jgi:AhpD family alkylhydroperoxidase